MVFEINNKQAGLEEDVVRRINRLLRFSLSRFDGIVTRVKVRCFDVNGPKGGLDKRCQITAKLKESGQVVVQGEGGDYVEAINSCLERVVRATRRAIDKRQDRPIRKIRREVRLFFGQDEVAVTGE